MTERFWELLAKHWSGEISKEEKAELEQLLLEHPDHWLRAGLADQLSYRHVNLLDEEGVAQLADRIVGKTREERAESQAPAPQDNGPAEVPFESRLRSGGRKRWLVMGVAMLVLAVGITIWYGHYDRSEKVLSWKKLTTAPGMKTRFILADGSVIWLNSGSTLRYPEVFSDTLREVFLSGEAYFKVKHDEQRPFIIHARRMRIRVLGTEFDVRAYPEEDFAEASLIRGAVEVVIPKGNREQKVLLKPKEKVVVGGESNESKEAVQVTAGRGVAATPDTAYDQVSLQEIRPFEGTLIGETAWKEDKLVFRDETLQSLATRLERWYGVKISIENGTLARERFTGRADNVSLPTLLRILQQIRPFTYSIKEGEVIIQ